VQPGGGGDETGQASAAAQTRLKLWGMERSGAPVQVRKRPERVHDEYLTRPHMSISLPWCGAGTSDVPRKPQPLCSLPCQVLWPGQEVPTALSAGLPVLGFSPGMPSHHRPGLPDSTSTSKQRPCAARGEKGGTIRSGPTNGRSCGALSVEMAPKRARAAQRRRVFCEGFDTRAIGYFLPTVFRQMRRMGGGCRLRGPSARDGICIEWMLQCLERRMTMRRSTRPSITYITW